MRFIPGSIACTLSLLIVPTARLGASDPPKTEAEQLVALERAWVQAETTHDTAALDRILDDTFVFTADSGRTLTKAQFIAALAPAGAVDQKTTQDVCHVYGDTAVIVGTDVMRWTDGTKTTTATGRYTVTYLRRAGVWRAVAEQIHRLADPAKP